MQNMKRYVTALALAAVVPLAACDDGNGITDLDGNFRVVLAPDPGGSASLGAQLQLQAEDASLARIPLDAVDAILLPIGRVEAKQGSGPGGAWIDAGDVDDTIDLFDLPAGGVVLVDSDLPPGNYSRLRMFLTDDATIVLNRDIRVGRVTFDEGSHDLRIPSADQAGIRLNADFDVDDDGQVLTVLFDDGATVRRVTATGAGTLMIAPVLTVIDDDDDVVGELNDDDDDDGDDGDDDDTEFEGDVASVDPDARSFTLADGTVVVIDDDTELEGDLLSLEAVEEALADGETVEAEGEGTLRDDGSILASEVEFDTDDDS